jgi:SsrA-binding protein
MNKIEIRNKKAAYEYYLVEEYSAGIMLTGTEIKSIRLGKANIAEAYCAFQGEELFIKNMNISEYDYGTYNNHEPRRDRKLLLKSRELSKLKIKLNERGFTLIPVLLFINDKGLAKLNIALARGKKLYDKRETIKSKDVQRDLDRANL